MTVRPAAPLSWILAFPICAFLLLAFAPTHPPRAPVSPVIALPIGGAAAVLLFAVLAGRARRALDLFSPAVLGAAVAVGASEEVIWRGFALTRLAPGLGLGAALAVSAGGFAATHFPAQRARGVVVHLGTGLVFGTLFVLTGSLLAVAGSHALYNVLVLAARSGAPPGAPLVSAPRAALSVRAVAKSFGRVEALCGVDLTVFEGEIVALLGPNGAGKTTLLSIVLGLRRADAGAVRVFDRDASSPSARATVAATPQEMSFPPTLRVREVVDFVLAHYDGTRARNDILERFGLKEVAARQTGGISGGQRRRLAVAGAFAGPARLALLDEPTAGLDVESRRHVWEAIRAHAAAGGTVLLTTHHLEEAEALADRIVVLNDGRVVGEGTAASLRRPDEATLEDAYLRLTGADA
ncbi:MAG TPA: ATP-binding cassette domain-containing protein [Gaiellaceae bacterium]|nr:ATP-binding cassette domain-containing protein [Gaiellaceae bacterium]